MRSLRRTLTVSGNHDNEGSVSRMIVEGGPEETKEGSSGKDDMGTRGGGGVSRFVMETDRLIFVLIVVWTMYNGGLLPSNEVLVAEFMIRLSGPMGIPYSYLILLFERRKNKTFFSSHIVEKKLWIKTCIFDNYFARLYF